MQVAVKDDPTGIADKVNELFPNSVFGMASKIDTFCTGTVDKERKLQVTFLFSYLVYRCTL